MPGESNHTHVSEPRQIELVKCHTCHAAITPAVDRCPYCGQLTTGTERRVSKLELDIQRRERLAEKRTRHVCKLCSRPVSPQQELCSACETKDKRKRLLFITIFAGSIIIVLWLFATGAL